MHGKLPTEPRGVDARELHAMYVPHLSALHSRGACGCGASSRPPPPRGLVVRVDWRNQATSAYRARAIPGRVPLDAMGTVGLLNLLFTEQGVDKSKRRCMKVQA